ncbi:MAG: glycosyltransferase family 2 protein [Planctomycetota bacterium]
MYISILIPTHNRCDLLGRTLESIGEIDRIDGVDVEVIVVANACTDDTVGVAERGLSALPFPGRVVEEMTPGLNVARTRSVEESQGDICALLDDDVWLDRGWLKGLREAFDSLDADVVGGRVDLWWEEVERPDWFPRIAYSLLSANRLGDEAKVLHQPWGVIGANFAFRRSLFDRIGGFRPGLDRVGDQLLGGGECEFVQRALAHDAKVVYAPQAQVKHWVPAKRLTREYMVGVSYGNGVSQVLMKPDLSAAGYLRSAAGHLWLWVSHAAALTLAKLKKDRGLILTHQCRVAVGRGGLVGLWQRLTRPRPEAGG